jgi:taurine dioxygenase
VLTHPENGRNGLFVNGQFTQALLGLSKNESNSILEMLYRHCVQPEYTCRFRWQAGSVAFWDNRATMHYALDDYGDAPRYAHRVTLRGDRPFGPAVPARSDG